ncbi:MAG: electron transfer flavoprotein subunit alpha/FixB family protein [Anaerolineae bacterium]
MANGVLVIADLRGSNVKRVTFEAINAARPVAQALGGPVQVALVGGPGVAAAAGPVGETGVNEVIVAESPDLASYSAESYTDAVQQLVDATSPALILLPATPHGRDLAPRVAARFGIAYAADVTKIEVSGGQVVVTRPVYSGNAIASVGLESTPAIVTLRPGAYGTAPREAGKSAGKQTPLAVNIEYAPGAKVVEFQEVKSERPDLSEATVVVSGGRGMGSAESFALIEELADLLGAAVGASRAVVDAGWRPWGEQVGQTGKTVNPNLYIACGISGAIQHLVGMRTSKYIVAINKDPEAPIFKVADYGIVGDVFTVLPLLTEEVKKAKSQ